MMESNELITAAKNGDYSTVIQLLTTGYSVHLRDKDEATALYWSSCRGYPDICEVLIRWKSEVDAQVKWGSTPLHAACDRNHIECVKLLIKSGANLEIQNTRGDTALHLSAYRGHKDIIKLLLHAHANLFIQNDNGKIPAQEAEGNNNTVSAQILRRRMKELSVRSQISGGDGEHVILSCPESLGPVLKQQIQASKEKTSTGFVRYNSEITDFTRHPHLTEKHLANDQVDKLQFTDEVRCCDKKQGLMIALENNQRSDKDVILKRQSVNSTANRVRQNRPSPTESIDNECLSLSSVMPNGTSLSNDQRPGLDLPCQRQPEMNEHLVGKGQKKKREGENIVNNRKETSLKEYTEMLQMHVLKSNEELSDKDAQVRELTSTLENNKRQIMQYQYLCRKFYDEKVMLTTQLRQTQDFLSELKKQTEQRNSENERPKHWMKFLPCHEHLQSYLYSTSQDIDAQTLNTEVRSKWCRIFSDRPRRSCNEEAWVVGRDYVVITDKAVKNVHHEFTSLSIDINRQGVFYMLKVIHPNNTSLDCSIFKHSLEYRILTQVSHPNILFSIHNFIGSTERLSKFLNISHQTDCPSPCIFIIHEKFPYTLATYLQRRNILPEECSMLSTQPISTHRESGINLDFTCCVLYQLLSAVSCLHREGVVHADINSDSVYLDRQLRPILGNFGLSKLHRQSITTADFKKYPSMKTDIDQDLIDIGRILKDLTASFDLPQVNDEVCVKSLAPSCIAYLMDRLTSAYACTIDSARKFMLYFGMLLFPPKLEDCSPQYIKSHIHSRMLKLLAFTRHIDESSYLTPSQSVDWLKPEIESHFLTSCTLQEFLEIYQDLRDHNLT